MLLQVWRPDASAWPHCRLPPQQRCAMLLRGIWTVAAEGRRSPGEQRKLRALRHVLQLLDKGDAEYDWMSTKGLVKDGTHPSRGRFGNSSSVPTALAKLGTWVHGREARPLCIHDPEEAEGDLTEHDGSQEARCRTLLRDRFELGASRDAERCNGRAFLTADGQRGVDHGLLRQRSQPPTGISLRGQEARAAR